MRKGFRRDNPISTLLRIILFLVSLAASATLRAQDPSSAQDRAQLLRAQPSLREDDESEQTGTDGSHAVATPNDPDLGEQAILKRSERYQPFAVVMGVPISYTSNVALASTNEEGDVLFTPNVAVIYAPRITRTLYASFSVAQQYFYYNEFPEFDFGSFDARAGLTYTLPRFQNLLLRADYSYNRLTSDDGFDEFFQNHAVNFGTELPVQIGRAQQVSVGSDLSFSIDSDPNGPGRNDYSVFVGYSVNLTRSLTANAVARVAMRDYNDSGRFDASPIFALGASYRFTKWLSASAISTFASNQSTEEVFEYDVFNLGGAAALNFRF